MRKNLILAVTAMFLAIGLSGCIVATVGKCYVADYTSKPCN